MPYPRIFNHFFDPQQDGIGLTVAGLSLGSPSPTWALEALDDLYFQDFSLRVGMEHHWNALALARSSERAEQLGALLEILGRTVHHIQDMAQPAHTRNDDHLPSELDFYESFTQNWFAGRAIPSSSPYGTPGVDLHVFNLARRFWTNGGKGLAEFTSRNFVSKNTNFSPARFGIYLPDSNHPLPVATGTRLIPTDERIPGSGSQLYITSQVTDAYSGPSFENDRASTHSFFSPEITVVTPTPPIPGFNIHETSLNRFNFLRNHEILLPRAIAYSVGFINYYFRGRLKVDRVEVADDIVTVTLRNRSTAEFRFQQQPGARGFALFYDRKDASRQPLSFKDAPSETIWPYDEARAFSFVIPADVDTSTENPFVLAFDGTIGEEQGIAAVTFGVDFHGILVEPNYPTDDGENSARVLNYRAGQWRSRIEPAQAGTIDWKGHRASDVLTWGTNPNRYAGPHADAIYMNGKRLTRGPAKGGGPIAGASIRYVKGQRILNVAKQESAGLRIYSRLFAEDYDNEDAWSQTNPLGWRLVHTGGNELLVTGVFFNASGTEAQYLITRGDEKERIKVFLFDDQTSFIRIPASAKVERTDRWTMNKTGSVDVQDGTCRVTSAYDDGELEGEPPCDRVALSGDHNEVQTHTITDIYTNKTIFCVDYRGDQEVFCEMVAPENPVTYTKVHGWQVRQSFSGSTPSFVCTNEEPSKDDFTFHASIDELRSGARVVRIGSAEIPWSSRISSYAEKRDTQGSKLTDYTGKETNEISHTNQTTVLLLADARYDLVVFDSKWDTQGASRRATYTKIPEISATSSSYSEKKHEVVAMHQGQRHVLFTEEQPRITTPESTSVGYQEQHNFFDLPGCAPNYEGYDIPTVTTLADPEAGPFFARVGASPTAYAIDSDGRLALSLLVQDPAAPYVKHGYRSILTDGDLPSLIPGVQPTDGYGYEIRLIR